MLPSSNRLLSKDIPLIMKTGLRIRVPGMEVIYFIHQTGTRFVPHGGIVLAGPRFAIIVSAKVDKRATRRNRMKRLVREALQNLLPVMVEGFCAVFVVRSRLPDTGEAVRALIHNALDTHRLLRGSAT